MLQRQTISLPLAQGVETKTDPKQVEAGKLLELENGVFTKTRSIQKRNGNVALGRSLLGSSSATVPDGIGLATYGTELLLADGSKIYSYDQGNNAWNDKGDYVPVLVTQSSVVKDTSSQTNPDGTTHASGLQAYIWQDSITATSIRYCIIDSATNQVVQPSTQLATNAIRARVIALDNVFAFYWVDTSTWVIKLATVLVSNPLAAATVFTLTGIGVSDDALKAGPSGQELYDVALIEGSNQAQIGLTFNNNNSGITTRIYSSLSPTTQLYAQKVIATATGSVLTVFSNNTDAAYNGPGPVVVFLNALTNNLTFYAYSNQLLTITFGDIDTGISGRNQLTACSRSDGPGFVVYAHELLLNRINQYIVDDTYSVTSVVYDFQADAELCGRAFKDGLSTFLPVVAYYAPIIDATMGNVPSQSATFLISESGKPVARALQGRSSFRTSKILPDAVRHDQYSYRLASTESLLVGENLYQTQSNVVSLDFTFQDPSQSVFHETIANNLHLSGGFLQMYDGVGVVEHGFHFYPRISNLTDSAGGNLSDGTYYYTVCYEWTDNQGNIHQSAPAASRKILTTPANQQVDVDVSMLAFTAKVTPRPVQIVLYRTLVDGNLFYRVSSLTSPDINDPFGISLTITDTMSDDDLKTRPQLYTQPLVQTSPQSVRNFPAPATNCIQLNRNRLWVVDSTSPLDIWYSKFSSVETPVAFNSGFVKQVDPRGGPITALSSIDDKLLVFKASHIFVLIGQGPTNTNENNDLSDSILVTTDCGCIDQRSIVATPVGLMFQSRKGIHLIDRSLAVQYIGSPVEAYNNEEITSAILVANTNQVRFTLRSGRTLVYDYFVGQWGTFTNQYGKDSTIWQATPILLRTDGSIWRETPGVYTDATLPIKLKLATSWFSFANLQGFQRVRRAQILGAWKTAHQLQVSVCTDFNDTIVQQAVVTPSTPTSFGAGIYGGESPYGGEFQLYQWRVDLARQKTQSVKFIIEDLPAATAGEGMSLSSIAFEVGAKVGLNKVPASQIVS